MKMSRRQARRVPWSHVVDGTVHAGTWSDYHGVEGLITFLDDDNGNVVCYAETDVEFAALGVEVKLWRDRASYGLPVCEHCEDDIINSEALDLS